MPVSGTYLTYNQKGLREDLSNVIYRISPEDTPFISSIGRTKAKGTLHEWQTDALRAAVTTNQVTEGNDSTFTTPSATVRVGNYTQIAEDTLILSGTAEVVDKAGRESEEAYQIALKGAAIKLDMEANALHNVGADAGGASTARKMATLGAWVKTNDSLGTSGGSPTYTSGVPAAARTDGTQRAFTETILKSVMSLCYTSGAKPRTLMVGPFNKTAVSAFSGVVTRNFDMSNVSPAPTAVIAAADVYVSDFGVLRVIPNRNQRERDGWFLDWNMLALGTLRPFAKHDLAKTGDAEKKLMNVEYTLVVRNEAGLGLAADLDAS